MYNLLQPVTQLTNANIEALSRFANSREVTELAKDSASKYLELVKDNMAKIAGSDAFATCLHTTIDNYVRFASEYTKNMYGILLRAKNLLPGRSKTAIDASLKLPTFRAAPLKPALNR